jgi:hypothetical protein
VEETKRTQERLKQHKSERKRNVFKAMKIMYEIMECENKMN